MLLVFLQVSNHWSVIRRNEIFCKRHSLASPAKLWQLFKSGDYMNSFLTIFGRDIPVYGLMYFCGIFVAGIVAVLLCKRRGIQRYDVVYSAVYSVIGGVLGAKLLFLAVSLKKIIELKIPLEAVIKGGFVFYGGLIGGFVGLYIYAKQFKMEFFKLADIYAVVLPLGHAFGRIGCHFAGCCYGMEYSGPFSIMYSQTLGNTPLNVGLLPIQLIESGLLFILFAVLCVLYLKLNVKASSLSYGYIFSYAAMRFVLEFFRGDKERGLALLSTSQWISIAIVIAFLLLKILQTKKQHR